MCHKKENVPSALALGFSFPPSPAMFPFCFTLPALCCGCHVDSLITDFLTYRNCAMANWDSRAMAFFPGTSPYECW